MEKNIDEFRIVAVNRYEGTVTVEWFGDYYLSVVVHDTIATKEELIQEILENKPEVYRSTAPVFDIAETMIDGYVEPMEDNTTIDDMLATLEKD